MSNAFCSMYGVFYWRIKLGNTSDDLPGSELYIHYLSETDDEIVGRSAIYRINNIPAEAQFETHRCLGLHRTTIRGDRQYGLRLSHGDAHVG